MPEKDLSDEVAAAMFVNEKVMKDVWERYQDRVSVRRIVVFSKSLYFIAQCL